MARPKVRPKHFVVCPRVSVDRAVPNNPYTLHDVKYTYDYPQEREFPVIEPELWLFVRFYFAGRGTLDFAAQAVWLDAPMRPRETGFYVLPPVRFAPPDLVVSRAWKLRSAEFPGEGRYVFRLRVGLRTRVLAEDTIYVRSRA
jgi:hypothetical protein